MPTLAQQLLDRLGAEEAEARAQADQQAIREAESARAQAMTNSIYRVGQFFALPVDALHADDLGVVSLDHFRLFSETGMRYGAYRSSVYVLLPCSACGGDVRQELDSPHDLLQWLDVDGWPRPASPARCARCWERQEAAVEEAEAPIVLTRGEGPRLQASLAERLEGVLGEMVARAVRELHDAG